MTIEDFLKIFRAALNRVDHTYFGLLLSSSSEMLEYARIGNKSFREILWDGDPRNEEVKDLLDRYDERVFCYELYHQVRSCMDEIDRRHPRFTEPFKFQGELRKDEIGKIALDYLKLKSLGKTFIPDFLLHAPGSGRHQGVVIEVKSARDMRFADLHDDLEKLERFINFYKYQIGISLVINNSAERMEAFLRNKKNRRLVQEKLPHRSNILLMCKEHPGKQLIEYNLGELPDELP